MPATNQRSSPHKRRKRPNSSLVHSVTDRRPTSLFSSAANATQKFPPAQKGPGMKKRARGKHRLVPKQHTANSKGKTK
jgi:hypothetical protein